MKTLIGFVTFGNLPFTQLTVNSIRETTRNEIDFVGVVGKPGDTATLNWLDSVGIPSICHTENFGFPYSLNDIYDYAWKFNDYDNLIIVGNDIVAYPYAIDSLIDYANSTDYLVISALQYDVKNLVRDFPETRGYFTEKTFKITDFSSRCWELFKHYSDKQDVADMRLYDIQNMCLYKKEVFERIGYTDVNFYPAYYVDNDYAMRIIHAKMKCCTLVNARFFHFWSRTIHQETGGSSNNYFENNRKYYKLKWGGDFGKETKNPGIIINNRDYELGAIQNWKRQG